jgi:predicted RNA polymerase sigma factor
MNTDAAITDAHAAADAVARRSYGKLVAFLAARTHDVAAAEDALSDAFAAALADWPRNGTPANPEAWLLTVARRKLIDASRRHATAEAASPELQLIAENAQAGADVGTIASSSGSQTQLSMPLNPPLGGVSATPAHGSFVSGNSHEIPDRRLALMFACAHPSIDAAVRAPLILQTILGLDAKKIASAFLVAPASMGKRLVRAKEKIRVAGIPFEIPEREDLAARLDAVLDAIYAAFTDGWADPAGADAVRADLTGESLFLARLVAELLPGEPEALGLLALILYAQSRRRARRNAAGEYVPLAAQDISLWDADALAEADAVLAQAGTLGRAESFGRIGRFQLEAAIQSAHTHRCRTGVANWHDVLALYDALFALTASPVVAINRALAVAELPPPDASENSSAPSRGVYDIAKVSASAPKPIEGGSSGIDSSVCEPSLMAAFESAAGKQSNAAVATAARHALTQLPDPVADPRLETYQPYWAARAELLSRAHAYDEARHAYALAIGLESDPAVRNFLIARQANLPA